ncbi:MULTISPECIES: hypothetical protein [Hymenobacter]|uniref:TIGR03067 domain-containing protein n=1 Tax=Hymenobacter jejuensis TaxID=2502781 RepID=A0A5B7ZWC7_9BACT|nr:MULTISPECIES: hypothetical protein [Hymenobacter]MBC6988372.1 hypothetical protein [Hymenobacter sp. BT491]QDA59278.1 hypothetical protein FHG12_03790 [Hymenobacter jejuensis]
MPTVEEQLVGRWEWVQTTTKSGVNAATPSNTGHTNVIEFDRRGRARFYHDGSLTGAAMFSVRRGVSAKNHRKGHFIIYRGYNNEQFCSVSGDKLFLEDAGGTKGSHVFFKEASHRKFATAMNQQ